MTAKRPTRDEVLKAFCEGSTTARTSDSVTISGLNAVAALFGGFAEEPAQVPPLRVLLPSSPGISYCRLVHASCDKTEIQGPLVYAVVAARSNAWDRVKRDIEEIYDWPGFGLASRRFIEALLARMNAPEMGVGPELKS